MLFFNLIGFAMLVVCGAVSEGIVRVLGSSNRDVQLLFAGVLFVLLDLMFRSWRDVRPFGRGGGTIMFLPVWLSGLALIALSIVAIVRGG